MTATAQPADQPPIPDVQAAGDFLRRRGFPIQIVTIDPDLPSGSPGKMDARIFQTEEPAQKWIAAQNSQKRNAYFTVNELRPSAVFNRKAAKADIQAMTWAHVDIDPISGETPRQAKERALADLRKFTLRPSVVIDSGGGVQAFWRLKEPVVINGNLDELELVNKSLELALGGDHCWNIDRIMRVPGTINWPDEKKRSKGRVPALAKLAYFGNETYKLSQFPISEEARGQARTGEKPRVDLGDEVQLVEDLSQLPALSATPWLLRLIELGDSTLTPYPSRSEALWAALHGMIDVGLDDRAIAGVILNPKFKISESVLDRRQGAIKYATAEIARAHAKHQEPVGTFGSVGTEEPPDLSVLNEGRRDPPDLPCEDDGPFLQWAAWIREVAESRSCPRDYVAASLLTAAGGLIGTARWASPWVDWMEPAVMFQALVGGSSTGKSPAFDSFKRAISDIETDLAASYPETLREWGRDVEAAKARKALWQTQVGEAIKRGSPPPDMPINAVEPEKPPRPRIVVNDTTQEELASLLANMPRGLLLQRDELSGWLMSFDRYSDGGDRQFWIEAFGGRSYVVDRVKLKGNPLVIRHLAVGVIGGIQPDRLNSVLLEGDDDGLSARFLLTWPNPVLPRRPKAAARQAELTAAFRRLRELPLPAADGMIVLPLVEDAAERFQLWREGDFSQAMGASAGRFASHVGKMPSSVLRLSLVLEYLWWSSSSTAEPTAISKRAIVGAIGLVMGYYLPMAERCYGDAALPESERHAAAIARWIIRAKPQTINARALRREHRTEIPGLPNEGEKIKAALAVLVDARWLTRIEPTEFARIRRDDYMVRQEVYGR